MAKKKLSEFEKQKLIYSIEMVAIAVVILVIGLLELFKVITISDNHKTIFRWVTIFGGTWVIADFVWMLVSKTRRVKNCLLDKILNLPLGIYLIIFDILAFANPNRDYAFFQIGIPMALFYISVDYIFQGIYHWYHPIPMILESQKESDNEKPNE